MSTPKASLPPLPTNPTLPAQPSFSEFSFSSNIRGKPKLLVKMERAKATLSNSTSTAPIASMSNQSPEAPKAPEDIPPDSNPVSSTPFMGVVTTLVRDTQQNAKSLHAECLPKSPPPLTPLAISDIHQEVQRVAAEWAQMERPLLLSSVSTPTPKPTSNHQHHASSTEQIKLEKDPTTIKQEDTACVPPLTGPRAGGSIRGEGVTPGDQATSLLRVVQPVSETAADVVAPHGRSSRFTVKATASQHNEDPPRGSLPSNTQPPQSPVSARQTTKIGRQVMATRREQSLGSTRHSASSRTLESFNYRDTSNNSKLVNARGRSRDWPPHLRRSSSIHREPSYRDRRQNSRGSPYGGRARSRSPPLPSGNNRWMVYRHRFTPPYRGRSPYRSRSRSPRRYRSPSLDRSSALRSLDRENHRPQLRSHASTPSPSRYNGRHGGVDADGRQSRYENQLPPRPSFVSGGRYREPKDAQPPYSYPIRRTPPFNWERDDSGALENSQHRSYSPHETLANDRALTWGKPAKASWSGAPVLRSNSIGVNLPLRDSTHVGMEYGKPIGRQKREFQAYPPDEGPPAKRRRIRDQSRASTPTSAMALDRPETELDVNLKPSGQPSVPSSHAPSQSSNNKLWEMLHGKPMASPKSTSPQLPTGSISVDQQPVLGNHARSRSPVRAQELDGSSIFFRIEGNGFIPTVDVESSAGINNRPLGQHTLGEMDPRERGRSTKRVPNPAKSGSSLVDRIEDHESNQIYPVDGSRTPLVQRLGVEAGLLAARIQRSSAGSSTQRRPYPTDFEKRIKP